MKLGPQIQSVWCNWGREGENKPKSLKDKCIRTISRLVYNAHTGTLSQMLGWTFQLGKELMPSEFSQHQNVGPQSKIQHVYILYHIKLWDLGFFCSLAPPTVVGCSSRVIKANLCVNRAHVVIHVVLKRPQRSEQISWLEPPVSPGHSSEVSWLPEASQKRLVLPLGYFWQTRSIDQSKR